MFRLSLISVANIVSWNCAHYLHVDYSMLKWVIAVFAAGALIAVGAAARCSMETGGIWPVPVVG